MMVFAIGVCTGLVSRRGVGRRWAKGWRGSEGKLQPANKLFVFITETALRPPLLFLKS